MECEKLKTRKDNFGITLAAMSTKRIADAAEAYKILDPLGIGLLMKIPHDGTIFDIFIITLKTAAGLGALAAAAQNWALRKNTPVERVLWLLAGLLLVFPSLLEALA